ncbi:hypothetical protein TNCV_3202701 [Trichonephila clavipes]|nr:hypothetical protein TNCV_3202701 [Trichonephila clavipes]
MVMAELRYECVKGSFLIDECRIKFFSGSIVNFVKHVRSTSSDHGQTGRRRAKRKHLERIADRPESRARAVALHISVNHQTVCRMLNENRLHHFHFQ